MGKLIPRKPVDDDKSDGGDEENSQSGGKQWYTSLVFWFNFLAAIIAAAAAVVDTEFVRMYPQIQVWIVQFIAIANVMLRFFRPQHQVMIGKKMATEYLRIGVE